ncbi:MAG: hypothetical protein K8I27_00810, partial [Planctomycetes bacterium]|nr:hypothetical protein [Planctomycetota bacterium]
DAAEAFRLAQNRHDLLGLEPFPCHAVSPFNHSRLSINLDQFSGERSVVPCYPELPTEQKHSCWLSVGLFPAERDICPDREVIAARVVTREQPEEVMMDAVVCTENPWPRNHDWFRPHPLVGSVL